ncbi:DUF2306 domain-containing protein [Pedobacter duraquae]|uniref:Putative membrane protein n=1 Tax=Pedobacter duraquae TaxID=425511 RepID=A0A4R6IKJ6_9SPHI|nr:DUF2306 domain-containing protein [Pedobacter duraquae]TDO22599.1 putative membrane protein [Pedobacter duraquae]
MRKNIMMSLADNVSLLRQILRIAWYVSILFFSYLMLLITLQYIPARTDVAFLRVKDNVTGLLHYRIAFFTHVYTSIIVLVCGIIQFSGYVRRRFLTVHRLSGRGYVILILLFAGPSGLIMGFYGNGGWVAQTAFCLLAILWMFFTYRGFKSALSGDLPAHRNWMYRSYALTLSAISLRLWKWVIIHFFGLHPMDAYQIVAWLGWTGNLLVAELLIYSWTYRRNKFI